MGFCEMLIEIEHGCIFLGFGFEHARSAQDPICNGVRAQRRRAWIRAQRKTEDRVVFDSSKSIRLLLRFWISFRLRCCFDFAFALSTGCGFNSGFGFRSFADWWGYASRIPRM